MKVRGLGVLFFICINIMVFGETFIFDSPIDIQRMALKDTLSLLSSVTGKTLVGESEVGDLTVDFYLEKGATLEEVVERIKEVTGVKVEEKDGRYLFKRSESGERKFLGRVVDEHYGEGLGGVRIEIKGEDKKTISDSSGYFQLRDIPKGTYIIKIRKDGYEEKGEIVEVEDRDKVNLLTLKRGRDDSYKDKEVSRSTTYTLGSESDELTIGINLSYILPREGEKVVKKLQKEVEVTAVDKLGTLIIKGKPSNVLLAKKVVEDLDKPQKQVKVTAQILDVTDNLFESLGFDWYYNSGGQLPPGATSDDIGSTASVNQNSTFGGIGNVFGSTFNLLRTFNGGDDVLGVTVSLLQGTQDLTISALPSVVIMNGEEAEFRITDEVIVGEEEIEDIDTEEIRTIPQFKEAGLIFKVKPLIKEGVNGDVIVLDVDTEVSNFNLRTIPGEENSGTFNEDGGSKSSRNIKTKVTVEDGASLFIGGLKRQEQGKFVSKVPLLGDIPGIRRLFRRESGRKELREIYIKIRAEVVDDTNKDEEIREFDSGTQEEKYKNIYPVFNSD